MVQDQQQGAPGKPFFLYFALGAMHAPHHVAPEWVDPYRGVFDKGWDAWRDELFARQVASGVVPEGTVLTPRPEWVRAWSDLSADERRMHSRQQEVFAGFLTHTDAQIGRVLSSLESLGAHGEHARAGLLRQRRQRRGWPAGQLQRAPLHGTRARVVGREPRPLRRLGRVQHVQPLLVGVGMGRQHPAQALEALHVAGRDAHTAHRALGRARRAAGPGAGTVRARHRPDAHGHGRRRARRARVGGWRAPAGCGRGQPARHARRSASTRAAPHAVLRDDGLALHLPRGMEGDDRSHRHGRPRRGGARRRQPRLRRGPLGAVRPVGGLLRGGGPRRRRARTPGPADRPVDGRGRAEQRPARFGRSGRPLRWLHPTHLARRPVTHLPARRRCRDGRVAAPAVGRLPHDRGRRDGRGDGRRCALRVGRLVRRLRPLCRGWRPPIHVRPRRRCTRAGRTVSPLRRPSRASACSTRSVRPARLAAWCSWSGPTR